MAENKGCQTFFCRRTSKRNLTVYIYNHFFFLHLNKKVNLKRLANSEDELHNVAAVLRIQKLYVAMFYLFANICPFYIRFLMHIVVSETTAQNNVSVRFL
jgi:hypothetical protein